MMTRISLVLLLSACILVSFNICATHAQETEFTNNSATIRGRVVDVTPKQEPIKGVTVTIVNLATDKEYTVTTDENGEYVKTGLPAGRYTIAVSKKGYGDRFSQSKLFVPGVETYDRIKMRKKETIITFIQQHFFTSLALAGFAIVLFLLLILVSLRSRV